MEPIADKVRQIIAKTLTIEADKVVDTAALADDLGADSLDMAELGMALQEEFGVEIADEQLAQIRTVKDVISAIQSAPKSA
jgi:acyl carrier protein